MRWPCPPQKVGLLSLKIFDPLTLAPLDQTIHREHRITTLSTHHSCMFAASRSADFDTSALIVIRAAQSFYHDRHSSVAWRRLIQRSDIVSDTPEAQASLVRRVFHLLVTTSIDQGHLTFGPRSDQSNTSQPGLVQTRLDSARCCASMPFSIHSDPQRCARPL